MLVLVLLIVGALSQDFTPTTFSTPGPTAPLPFQGDAFIANLCSNKAYDSRLVTVDITFPLQVWNPVMSTAVALQVFQSTDNTVVANNSDLTTGQLKQSFNFKYSAAYGDLIVVVTSLNVPNIVYTFDLGFSSTQDYPPDPSAVKPIGAPFKATADPTPLKQFLNTLQVYQVMTQSLVTINWAYCPTSSTYSLIVAARATDLTSDLALYVCLPTETPCGPATASRSRSDPTGAAVASVLLSTTTKEYQTLQAAVVGWGNFGQMNNFVFVVGPPPDS